MLNKTDTTMAKIVCLLLLASLPLTCASAAEVGGIQAFSFGECRIVSIQDAPMKLPSRIFFDTSVSGRRPSGDFHEASVNVFLVHSEGKVVLIDAGHAPERGSLREKLHLLNVSPEEISDIFITHINADHVGGLLWEGKPLFPKAVIHIARVEYDAWKKDASRSNLARYLPPYTDRLHLFEYGETLPCGLVPEKRGGHTPGHTIFRMTLPGQQEAIFVGDIVHAVDIQFPQPTICAKYDESPADAVISRIQTLQMDGILFGAHFPFPGAANGGATRQGSPDWSFAWKKYTYTSK